ncbi:acyl-CoA dehydrogenase family protein [Blastomonas aquatica]|uniref:Acyl-CoA dehydrogenase n=1 Tax=Blastomonas aquatica TaxID=1510276 RepID=A0ABQ1JCX7_9SPHN|nr:acyl-CoA dehydrogenase family protein [Blastomonas aquatica]GGB65758.1 acyl-CoA dehydrogenase [Blastomonas aquatica]
MSMASLPVPASPDCVAAAAALAERLGHLGARYDAAPVYPADSIALIVRAGLHRTFAPVASGGHRFAGEAARHLAMLDVLRIIGRADLSVGRLYEGHVNALLLFGWYATPVQLKALDRSLAAGSIHGVWATEPPPGVAITESANGPVLKGGKSFATGAGGNSHALITARRPSGETQLVIVRADDPERADLSNWRVRGMRATGSGSYALDGIAVTHEDCLGEAGVYHSDPWFTTGAWRFTAVQLGGIEGLLTEIRTAMRPAAREDSVQRARFADAVAATRTAYLWVRECALRAASQDADGPAFAQMTRGIVERAGLDVMEAAARITGTYSALDGTRIDKISRDLSLYLRQAGPDYARDQAAQAWLERDPWGHRDRLW